jgi:hypothetical protein
MVGTVLILKIVQFLVSVQLMTQSMNAMTSQAFGMKKMIISVMKLVWGVVLVATLTSLQQMM